MYNQHSAGHPTTLNTTVLFPPSPTLKKCIFLPTCFLFVHPSSCSSSSSLLLWQLVFFSSLLAVAVSHLCWRMDEERLVVEVETREYLVLYLPPKKHCLASHSCLLIVIHKVERKTPKQPMSFCCPALCVVLCWCSAERHLLLVLRPALGDSGFSA